MESLPPTHRKPLAAKFPFRPGLVTLRIIAKLVLSIVRQTSC